MDYVVDMKALDEERRLHLQQLLEAPPGSDL